MDPRHSSGMPKTPAVTMQSRHVPDCCVGVTFTDRRRVARECLIHRNSSAIPHIYGRRCQREWCRRQPSFGRLRGHPVFCDQHRYNGDFSAQAEGDRSINAFKLLCDRSISASTQHAEVATPPDESSRMPLTRHWWGAGRTGPAICRRGPALPRAAARRPPLLSFPPRPRGAMPGQRTRKRALWRQPWAPFQIQREHACRRTASATGRWGR